MNRGSSFFRVLIVFFVTFSALSISSPAKSYTSFKIERGEDYGHDHIKKIISDLIRQEYHLPVTKGNVFFLASDCDDMRLKDLLFDLYQGDLDTITTTSSHDSPRIVGLLLKDNENYYIATKDEYIILPELRKILVYRVLASKYSSFFPLMPSLTVTYLYRYRVFDFDDLTGVIWL